MVCVIFVYFMNLSCLSSWNRCWCQIKKAKWGIGEMTHFFKCRYFSETWLFFCSVSHVHFETENFDSKLKLVKNKTKQKKNWSAGGRDYYNSSYSWCVVAWAVQRFFGFAQGDKKRQKVPPCIIVLELMWGGVEGSAALRIKTAWLSFQELRKEWKLFFNYWTASGREHRKPQYYLELWSNGTHIHLGAFQKGELEGETPVETMLVTCTPTGRKYSY